MFSKTQLFWLSLLCMLLIGLLTIPINAQDPIPLPKTYYVSSTTGNDGNTGLAEILPLKTMQAVNALLLQPGDQVLFKCGDIWRAETLNITQSGQAGSPLLFGSYPTHCDDKPIISGAQPIGGWVQEAGNVYVADLSTGVNVGLFEYGINQLFRDGSRLQLGRWPNRDANDDGGYATVDGQPGVTTLVDNDLPAGNWQGGVVHLKSIRWLMLNRVITASNSTTLTLTEETECADGCAGWGYFINNHRQTLDQDGEWFYEADTNRVYLYSTSGAPADGAVEGSVVMNPESRYWGGIVLGRHLQDHISHVTIENFQVQHWYESGITTPLNLELDDNAHLIIRRNHIKDVVSTGIRLATWVWNASNGVSGWRGGHNLEVSDNLIEGATHFGLDSYAYSSLFRDNEIRNIGLIADVGRSGLGCGFSGNNCTENGNGIRIKLDNVAFSAHNNRIEYNRLEKIGMNGIDVFGPNNTLAYNVIRQACYSKGDCGAIRTFGRDNLTATNVHDITISHNIIVDTIGNTDGTSTAFRPPFGIGLYIDNYSRGVTVANNVVISSTIDGLLYQHSTGNIQDNIFYNNNIGTMGRGQVGLYNSDTSITEMTGNVLYGLHRTDAFNFAKTLHGEGSTKDNIAAANNNYYFNPYRADHISVAGLKTLAEWQAYSGLDANSKTTWFTLEQGEEPRSTIFYNDTKTAKMIDLGNRTYLDLDQQPVSGSITLQPFTAQVLIDNGQTALTLTGFSPTFAGLNAPADFTLTVMGSGFTESSVVRWNGANRSTTYVDSSQLTATILATDVVTAGTVAITVYDPGQGEVETAPGTFNVIETTHSVYLPLTVRCGAARTLCFGAR